MQKQTPEKAVWYALLIGLFVACGWMMGTQNQFVMDSYSTVARGIFNLPSDLFTLLPTSRYNDRPLGSIFVGLLYILFKTNEQGYHIVFVLVHLVSVFLVYRIAKLLFADSNTMENTYSPVVAAAIFGIYPQSIMAPQWVAAVFDVTCCFFVLCSIYAFLMARQSNAYSGFYSVCAFAAYVLSLRSKEMSLFLPIFYVFLELLLHRKGELWKISKGTCAMVVWMIVFLARLFSFPGVGGSYEQSFHPLALVRNLVRYIALYVDLFEGSMAFTQYYWSMLPGFLMIVIAIIFSICYCWKHEYIPLLSVLGTGILLAPVLPMIQMQHKLYLYIPSVFISLMIASLLAILLGKRNKKAELVSVIIIGTIALTNYFPGAITFRQWWCSIGQQDNIQLQQIYRFGELPLDCTVYVRGATDNYNVIYPYGPGHSVQLMYGRDDIVFEMVGEFPEVPAAPYVFWDYADGSFRELERKTEYDISIISASYQIDEEGTLHLGVNTSKIYSDIQILVNGEECFTAVGDIFISTAIEKERWQSLDTLEIVVTVNSLEIRSDPYILPIEESLK